MHLLIGAADERAKFNMVGFLALDHEVATLNVAEFQSVAGLRIVNATPFCRRELTRRCPCSITSGTPKRRRRRRELGPARFIAGCYGHRVDGDVVVFHGGAGAARREAVVRQQHEAARLVSHEVTRAVVSPAVGARQPDLDHLLQQPSLTRGVQVHDELDGERHIAGQGRAAPDGWRLGLQQADRNGARAG